MSKIKKYHKYVFDIELRKYIGAFNEMYAAEKSEGFDSWDQNDLDYLEKKLCLQILEDYKFNSIVDVGCGKGAMTQLMKTKSNQVIGMDVSSEAIAIAMARTDDVHFIKGDINRENLHVLLKGEIGEDVDCITCLETLSYLSNWKKIMHNFSTFGRYLLIKLYIPENPIGFVKTKNELKKSFLKNYDIIEHIEFVNKNITILFGNSKNNKGD